MKSERNRRQIAAEATREAIIVAAAELFAERGYHGTAIADIAGKAGVAVQTIYNAVGSKAEVLSRVLDRAAAGSEAPRRVPEFMKERAEEAADARAIIFQLVEFWRGGLARTAPVFGIIREAAATEPEVAALEHERAEQRLGNYGHATRLMAEKGWLRHGLTAEDAAAAVFALGHPDVYRFLVLKQGWPPERWAAWVRGSLVGALLGEG
jgi:AcrR family transcriptional regulator